MNDILGSPKLDIAFGKISCIEFYNIEGDTDTSRQLLKCLTVKSLRRPSSGAMSLSRLEWYYDLK